MGAKSVRCGTPPHADTRRRQTSMCVHPKTLNPKPQSWRMQTKLCNNGEQCNNGAIPACAQVLLPARMSYCSTVVLSACITVSLAYLSHCSTVSHWRTCLTGVLVSLLYCVSLAYLSYCSTVRRTFYCRTLYWRTLYCRTWSLLVLLFYWDT